MSASCIEIDIRSLYTDTAKLADLGTYEQQALAFAGDANDVILTGQGPVWLYLRLAHVLHGKARRLTYRSPVTGDIVIFDHNPY